MEYRASVTILFSFVFCLSSLTIAQTASISDAMTVQNAADIPQAKVTGSNLATNGSRNTATDGSGTYRITSLTPGLYDVLVEKDGFKTVEYTRVELTVGQVQNLNPVLSLSAAR